VEVRDAAHPLPFDGSAFIEAGFCFDAGPTASFTATPTSGPAPLLVSFTDTSTPGTAPIVGWAWTFGDLGTSTSQNPTHTYYDPATRTVTLTVTDGNGLSDTSPPQSITITEPSLTCDLTATVNPNGNDPLYVRLDATATGGSGSYYYAFDFGDGNTYGSSSGTVFHGYATVGTYTATVVITDTVYDLTCTATATFTLVDTTPGCLFSATPTTSLTCSFDITVTNPDPYCWFLYWDDGSAPQALAGWAPGDPTYTTTVSHTFPTAGLYLCQLRAIDCAADPLDPPVTYSICSLSVYVGDCEITPVYAPDWPEPLPPDICFAGIQFEVGGYPDGTYSLAVDWGDGSPIETESGSGTVSELRGHLFASGGSYLVTLDIVITPPPESGLPVLTQHCEATLLLDCGDCPPSLPSIPDANCLPGATLGSGGDLRVFLTTRGATKTLAELFPVSGTFTRALDATSTLEMVGVVGGMVDEACCDDWDSVYPWNTEILVYRDGRDAWSGPVTSIDFAYGTVTVRASDLTAWWDRRTVGTLNFVGADLSDIFSAVHQNAMGSDPIPNFVISPTPTHIYGDRSYAATDYKYAADLLDELSKTGLDWTCFGRTVLIGGSEVPADPYFTIFDDFWTEPPKVMSKGDDQATQVVVRGKGVTGTATADASYLNSYGLIVRVFDENNIEDQPTVDRAAETRLAMLQDQTYIAAPSGAGLTPNAPITLAELVPGIRVRVVSEATCRKVTADFRLSKVKVDFTGQVAIDLQPLGTDTSNDEPAYAKMIAIGDSMTAWSAAAAEAAGKGEPWTLTPTNRWQDLMVTDGVVGYSLNGAYPGLTTRSARYSPFVPAQSGDLLVVMLGANDMVHQNRTFPPGPFVPDPSSWVLPAEYQENLEWLMDNYPCPKKVIVFPWKWNVNFVDSAWDTNAGAAARMAPYRAAALAAAVAKDALFVDLSGTYDAPSLSQNPLPNYLVDALIHPSDAGHRGIANLIEGELIRVVPG
jgi:PKD repeat protein